MWQVFEVTGEAALDLLSGVPLVSTMPRVLQRGVFLMLVVGAAMPIISLHKRFVDSPDEDKAAVYRLLQLPEDEVSRSMLLLGAPIIALYLMRMVHVHVYQSVPARGPGGHLWQAGVTFVFWFMSGLGTLGFEMDVYFGELHQTLLFVGV